MNQERERVWLRRSGVALLPLLLIMAATTPSAKDRNSDRAAATKGQLKRSDLEIVDCLLPGQVRQLGKNMSYLTQRRPIRTTASECGIRGGEYVAYDRADIKQALRIWLDAAQAGDAEAQFTVGEIYERGLGVAPDYAQAAEWYQKAAAQNYSRAFFNLGSLHEQGLGVPQDKLKALDFYRRSWGLPEDSVIYASAAQRQRDELLQEQAKLRNELEQQLNEKDGQLQVLQKQLGRLQDELKKKPAEQVSQSNPEVETLRKLISQLQADRDNSQQRLAGMPMVRTAEGEKAMPTLPPATAVELKGMQFGRYYAVVIGDQNYRSLDTLQTPLTDAARAARVLADKYGFNVAVLKDANDVEILKALNDLNAVLQPNDNVLIYYAGHGARLPSTTTKNAESGYWLPVNADPPPKDTFWVPNEQITGHLARLVAKRVLVISDSCYAGLLSSDPSYLFLDGKVSYSKDYITYKLPKRARLLLASGGDFPVLDAGGNGNSIFARALFDELEANDTVLSTPELFTRIRKRVEIAASKNRFVQVPEFKSIKGAGHEVGDFFFVPKPSNKTAQAGE
jgi:hypothetical protein